MVPKNHDGEAVALTPLTVTTHRGSGLVAGDRLEAAMKVLVTTTGKSLDSPVDPRFGRAELFAVVETETNQLDIVTNDEARGALQGAGIQAAELAVRLGVQVVLTGHCGPKAFAALQAAGVQVVAGASGTVAQAIEALFSGKLQPTTSPDVRGHWA